MAKRILIVGGGASGLMAAVQAARMGARVTVLERNDRPGKKLLATGNGRCNYTNLRTAPGCYRSSETRADGDPFAAPADPSARRILERFGARETIAFFSELGIEPAERDGWVYPASFQAQAVLDVLLMEARYRKVTLKTRETVRELSPSPSGGFLVRTDSWQYEADRVIVSCGSPASQTAGASGDALRFAGALGIASAPFCAALCPLKCRGGNFSLWAGTRVRAEVTLLADGAVLGREEGELQLTDAGISGIPVFQLSRFAVRLACEGRRVEAELCFLPGMQEGDLAALLARRKEACPYKATPELLIGLLPDRLIAFLTRSLPKGQENKYALLASRILRLRLQIPAQDDCRRAQVCSGGVLLSELTDDLEARAYPGLYFAGEALDVDGACGGYNLQWAWASGTAAGRAAAGKERS